MEKLIKIRYAFSTREAFSMVVILQFVCGQIEGRAFLAASDTPKDIRQTNTSSTVFNINRQSFPTDFVFGCASASYQVEGGVNEGGRGIAVWDTVSHDNGQFGNADIACDSYHRYEEDIQLLRTTGFDAYRFSIAWVRIFPDGKGGLSTVNKDGVDYYNHLIDGLLSKGIQPYVTLYHWDLPQALMDSFGGWMGREIVSAFANYVDTCFALFGDRVKHWFTINEPSQFVDKNYGCKNPSGNCGPGNATVNLYLSGHNILLAHAAAVQVYRSKFQAEQKGIIGIVTEIQWFGPLTESADDLYTHQLAMALKYGWFLNPIVYGDYADILKDVTGSVLPRFTQEESEMLKKSFDFVGINHYTSQYVTSKPIAGFIKDTTPYPDSVSIYTGAKREGALIGPQAGSAWLNIVPSGMEKVLDYVRLSYNNPVIYITENGVSDRKDLPMAEQLKDHTRIQYHHDYLGYLLKAMSHGADVRGYFVWSLLDSFEWADAWTVGFGLHTVDRHTMKRIPKESARWFKKFLMTNYVREEHAST